MLAEHRGEGALAGVAAVDRDIDDPLTAGEAFEREGMGGMNALSMALADSKELHTYFEVSQPWLSRHRSKT